VLGHGNVIGTAILLPGGVYERRLSLLLRPLANDKATQLEITVGIAACFAHPITTAAGKNIGN
jgi:hypothetical protein